MKHSRGQSGKPHHGHPHKPQHGRPPAGRRVGGGPGVPAGVPTAAATGRGLDSPLVRKQVLDVLNRSEWREVESLFNQMGFKSSKVADDRPNPRDAAVDLEARRHLQTDVGRDKVRVRVDQLVDEAALRELASAGGRQRVERVMAAIFAERLSEDADGFTRACRQEVLRLVERWLSSPAGKEHVEVERKRAALRAAGHDGQAGRPAASVATRFVQQPLPAASPAGGNRNE